jgi:hypothetical protein
MDHIITIIITCFADVDKIITFRLPNNLIIKNLTSWNVKGVRCFTIMVFKRFLKLLRCIFTVAERKQSGAVISFEEWNWRKVQWLCNFARLLIDFFSFYVTHSFDLQFSYRKKMLRYNKIKNLTSWNVKGVRCFTIMVFWASLILSYLLFWKWIRS